MSFSKNVKEELSLVMPKSRHCRLAELAGLINLGAKNNQNDQKGGFTIYISDEMVLRKYFTLLNKTLNITFDVVDYGKESAFLLKESLKLSEDYRFVDKLMLQQPCCKRAYIRGAFLAAGSISDPNKGYHFEIVCSTKAQASFLASVINTFDVEAKVVSRNGRFVVYLKEGSQIVEILGLMEASHSVMELENIRVVKEVRGTINRKVNCETANISKTVNAAVKQIEDINLIEERVGIDSLPESLQEIAYVRLENPDMALSDLGNQLDPPLGKSGVNHRLKRLAALAESYRSI